MVWGGVKERSRTLLVVDAGYLTGRRYVIPFIQAQAKNVTFQQDNARPHIVRVVRDYLTQQNVDVLPWPAVSSDLSPIEQVWDEMERRLRHLQNQPATLADMGPALIRIWNNIPEAFFNTLIRSMRRRFLHQCKWWTHTLLTLVMSKRPFCCSKHLPNKL